MKAIIHQTEKILFLLTILSFLGLNAAFSVSPQVVAPFSAVYDGDWETAGIWDPGSVPPISGNNNNLYIYIEDDVSVTFGTPYTTDKMDFKNQFHLYLLPGATLEVFGDISIDNQFEFIVYPGQTLLFMAM